MKQVYEEESKGEERYPYFKDRFEQIILQNVWSTL
jgi:hypothetical protein